MDKQEGDIAFFLALSIELEYLSKLVVAGIIACVGDDSDRHRYSLEYSLARADSLGEWIQAMNAALTGPAAQFFLPGAASVVRDLTERSANGNWRFEAVQLIGRAAKIFGIEAQTGSKVSLRQLFELVATLRNRTRGHGATTSTQCSEASPLLQSCIELLHANLKLFCEHSWAYLNRNLSGKFRVSPLVGECNSFDYLKKTKDESLPNGVFIDINGPVLARLLYSDADVRDILLPNGNFRTNTLESLSFITNNIVRQDASFWSVPPGPLPASETHGTAALEPMGNVFANLPPTPTGHIVRKSLESQLREELVKFDRHPIVTLTGPGGIGKTTLTLAVIRDLCRESEPAYELILWMSARDIDLLESGPKPVTPRVVRKSDIARSAAELLEPQEKSNRDFNAEQYFQNCLEKGAAGRTLFVFDNFETLESPTDIFQWIDTFVRLPNKVLITTRFRDFAGDYPIEIGGMTDDEATALIAQESERLGVSGLVGAEYRNQLLSESDGHPYVIKILLGQVAKERRALAPRRIVASAEHLLAALFERTFESLSPGGQRVFLLLCSWRVFVPAIAVEAVALRPGNERFDVVAALAELRRFSLVEEVQSGSEDEMFVGVPLVAASFGIRKLEVSPFKVSVEEDRKLLMDFGAGKREDAHRGVLPRIDRLVRIAAERANDDPSSLETSVQVLEYLASRVPDAYLRLADLMLEVGNHDNRIENAKVYLRRFLETARANERLNIWLRLADICHSTDDALGEVHALGEAALLPSVSADELGSIANRLNNQVKDLKTRGIGETWSTEVSQIIERVAIAMDRRASVLSATDCSRLAWLYLNIGRADRADVIARRGLELDAGNEHCLRLVRRLKS